MVKVVNIEDINPGDQLQFSIKMSYEEDSWDGSSDNDVIWSVYGNQVYEKNGGESGYLHVMDRIKLEIVKAPVIKENLMNIVANINDAVTLDANIDLGIPLANIKWQYRENSKSNWIDLSETSNTLTLDNINYLMDGYEYRYEASNKGGSVVSNIATLNVIDDSAPIIKLTELRDGDSYKIRIDVTDEDNGVSHMILPDGSRVDTDTYTIDAIPNVEYVFKAYDLADNESIATITIISGLEPKTVTANLDIYIKSENMLSLSLSNNSISFEDFNGTEDLEQNKALEISINSSLPYEINAYLEEEIQNSDKTEIMDKRILNLKENSTTDYEEFSDIKTKLTLLSNSDAGNGKIHSFDFKLKGGIAHKKDIYKTTIKFEVNQK